MSESVIYVAGTFDTKSDELGYIANTLAGAGVVVKTVDLAATGNGFGTDLSPQDIAAYHPQGVDAVFTGDRGTAVAGMAIAFKLVVLAAQPWLPRQCNPCRLVPQKLWYLLLRLEM